MLASVNRIIQNTDFEDINLLQVSFLEKGRQLNKGLKNIIKKP